MSLTRQRSRFIYAITIKIMFREPSAKIEGRRLSRNIRLEERGVLNSCDSVSWLSVSDLFCFSYLRSYRLSSSDLMWLVKS